MKTKILSIFLISFYFTGSAQTNYPFDVQISGKGKQAIIFIPGFTCSGDVWNETKKVYEEKFSCHVLTMHGFAGTQVDANPQLKNWVASIAQYIKDKKLEKPIVIGHSLGGGMAMWLASDYPDLLSKIVVVDALPCYSCSYDSTFKSKEKPDCSRHVEMYAKTDPAVFYSNQKKTTNYLLADTSKNEMVTQWACKSDRNTMGQLFCQFLNTDLRMKIGNINCPSLILLEAPFKDIPSITKQYIHLKNAKIHYATKGLHFIMYDDKVWFEKELAAFIN